MSTVQASLTVITENEATYFATGNPNLADADVRVRSLTSGASFSLLSGPDGIVTFDDLVEDVYEITAQKLGHSQFSTTILLQAPGQTVQAFLKAQVVSYTFTVVEIPVVSLTLLFRLYNQKKIHILSRFSNISSQFIHSAAR